VRPKLAAALLVGLAAILAGCGGSSKTANTSAATTSAATTSAAATTTATETSGAGETTTPAIASGKNCIKLLGLSGAFAQASQAINGKSDLENVAKFYQVLADKAPSEIRPDIQVIAKVMTTYIEQLSKAHFKPGTQPTPAQIQALTKAAQSFNQPDVAKASAHIQAWAKKNCSS
jgi:S-adenosylmethionine synthetase